MPQTSRIQIESFESMPTVATALEMLHAVSLATDENELFAAFAHRFNELSCVTHLLSLMVDGCEQLVLVGRKADRVEHLKRGRH
ncbi:MAG: hypothetical protein AAFY46_00815, partial [Planctomycetota bacterium]